MREMRAAILNDAFDVFRKEFYRRRREM